VRGSPQLAFTVLNAGDRCASQRRRAADATSAWLTNASAEPTASTEVLDPRAHACAAAVARDDLVDAAVVASRRRVRAAKRCVPPDAPRDAGAEEIVV
jgi:hypothetical protein